MQVTTMAADYFSCNEHLQASTLITRNKDKPSNRVESGLMWTPWVKGDDMKKRTIILS